MKYLNRIISTILITIILLTQYGNITLSSDAHWKAVGYEAAMGAAGGALGALTGGTGSCVVKQGGKVLLKETAKKATKKVLIAGATEGLCGAAEDIGRQMIVEGKSLKEVDYGQAMKTGAVSGVSGACGELFGCANDIRKASSRNIRKAATKEIKKDAGEELSERLTKNSDKNLAKKAQEIKSIGTNAATDNKAKNLGNTLKKQAKNEADNLNSLPKGSIQSVKSGIDADDYLQKAAKNTDLVSGSKAVGKRDSVSNKIDYKKVFFNEYPEAEGKVVVHHSVEQQVLTKPQTKGLFSYEEMHSIDNLRGIPKEINSDLHLSKIRKEWNRFYKEFSNPTRQQLLDKAAEIDSKFGHLFYPPLK